MAIVDLYKFFKKEAYKVFTEERERRKRALSLRLQMQRKPFDKGKNIH
ncbi:MAG: hypothetical protein NZ531_01260 [Aquificaceae bacterium]|nr:hypothetical protein [Aquificaceae bacterium]